MMLDSLLLLIATAITVVLALPTIEVKANSSPLRISRISYDGPTCNTGNTSPAVMQSNAGLGATDQVGFDSMTANAKPEGDNVAFSDCTLTVDFDFPIGFHINYVDALAKGLVEFGEGMTQMLRMDIWFPSKDSFTVSDKRILNSCNKDRNLTISNRLLTRVRPWVTKTCFENSISRLSTIYRKIKTSGMLVTGIAKSRSAFNKIRRRLLGVLDGIMRFLELRASASI